MTSEVTNVSFTVRDALALPALRRGEPEVLAGNDRLDVEIRWMHAGEGTNLASLLKGGELLVTTGMGISANKATQARYVADLADRGIAALALELGSAMTEVPASLIEAAREQGLCLIAFHREVRFVEISEGVHRAIIDRDGELLRRGDASRRRLLQLMLSGAHISEVLVELAATIRNPVVLERASVGIAYHVGFESDDATVLGAWGSYARGNVAAPRVVTHDIPGGSGGTWGRLVALEIDNSLRAEDHVVLERVVDLLALALLRRDEEDELAVRERGDFLAQLVGNPARGREIATRAADLGFSQDAGAVHLLPLAIAPPGWPGRLLSEPEWAGVLSELAGALEHQQVAAIAGTSRDGLALMVLGLKRSADRERLANHVANIISQANARHLVDGQATICVGTVSASWTDAGTALGLVVDSVPSSITFDPRLWHDVSVASTDRLLFALRGSAELQEFADRRLQPLLDHSGRDRSDLLETLEAFCSHAGNKVRTARALHIERQTLYNRLRRIEKVLDVDLDDGESRLALHLAMRARRHRSVAR